MPSRTSRFSVGAGEIVCVVGESGSGKSVTAQAVMGLLPRELAASAGEARLQGEDVLAASPSRLRDLRGTRMAMIFQEPMTALNPVMKVGDQIAEVLEIHTELSEPDRRQRALQIMRAVHLPEPERLIDVYPHQLSGGQRQRIMIAAALVLDPALLIADEPTTALDVTTQAQILRLMRELQERRGTGVLFITHDFGVVAEVAHRVVVMQSGRVVEMGTRDDILRRPQSDYTRMLIASVPSLKPPVRAPKVGATALAMERLSKTYGGKGFLFGRGRVVRAAENVDITVRRGETVGIVGEFGLGQDHGGALRRPADRAHVGRHPHRRRRRGAPAREPPAPAPPARADRVPGPLPLAQSAAHRRRLDHRGPGQLRPLRGGGDEPRAAG